MNSITVSKLVTYLKSKLENDPNLTRVLVSGEISNFHKQLASGHCYFVLKDEKAQISCVMFKSSAIKLNFEPKNGDKVIISSSASIYEGSGQLQLYVTSMKLDGLGDLYQKYEALKKKLEDEGYFDNLHKKEKTFEYPNKVAVLVGDKSAAMSDIRTCFNRRWPITEVDYYPVLVQGESAPLDIIKILLKVDDLNYDAIILARGGGSFEDLFCFNDENLVKCIYNLKTFIVTGIGHEQDFTLVDFVSDLRAPTPTASVELITPLYEDVKEMIYNYKINLSEIIRKKIENKQLTLDYKIERLKGFKKVLISLKGLIDNSIQHINHIIKTKLNNNINIISNYDIRIKNSTQNRLIESRLSLKRLTALLKAYSSENVLKKGYSITFKDDLLIKSINDVNLNDELRIMMLDGELLASVKEKTCLKKNSKQS